MNLGQQLRKGIYLTTTTTTTMMMMMIGEQNVVEVSFKKETI
jgi:hypothetical protein